VAATSALTSQYFVLEVLAAAFGLSAISVAGFVAAVPSSVLLDYDGIMLRWDRVGLRRKNYCAWLDNEKSRLELVSSSEESCPTTRWPLTRIRYLCRLSQVLRS